MATHDTGDTIHSAYLCICLSCMLLFVVFLRDPGRLHHRRDGQPLKFMPLYRRAGGGQGGNPMGPMGGPMDFGRNKSKFQEVPETGITFDDVAVSIHFCATTCTCFSMATRVATEPGQCPQYDKEDLLGMPFNVHYDCCDYEVMPPWRPIFTSTCTSHGSCGH